MEYHTQNIQYCPSHEGETNDGSARAMFTFHLKESTSFSGTAGNKACPVVMLYLFKFHSADVILLPPPTGEEPRFNSWSQPVPRPAKHLHRQRYAHSYDHVQDQVARSHGVDHPHLRTRSHSAQFDQQKIKRNRGPHAGTQVESQGDGETQLR